jgi:hypothetical protein
MNRLAQSIAEKEIKDLVALGNTLVQQAASAHSTIEGEPVTKMMMWATRGGQLIQRLYGKDNEYFRTFTAIQKDNDFSQVHSNNYSNVLQLLGIFMAVEHEINVGLLVDIRGLLRAEVFADFLEMAEHLLDQNYKDAAAVVIGAVLEDVLRKIAEKNGLSATNAQGRPLTIEPLNVAVTKSGTYNSLVQRQVSTWGALRNSAAHGKYADYDVSQVKEMLGFVQKFASDYLP